MYNWNSLNSSSLSHLCKCVCVCVSTCWAWDSSSQSPCSYTHRSVQLSSSTHSNKQSAANAQQSHHSSLHWRDLQKTWRENKPPHWNTLSPSCCSTDNNVHVSQGELHSRQLIRKPKNSVSKISSVIADELLTFWS